AAPIPIPGRPRLPALFGDRLGSSLFLGANPADPQQMASENTAQRLADLEKDPVVGVKRPFKADVKPYRDPFGLGIGTRIHFSDLLPELARTYHVHFIADAYGGTLDRLI